MVDRKPADATEVVVEQTIRAGTYRLRRRGLLEQWRTDGGIDSAMYDAGLRFERDFEAAHMRDHYGGVMEERLSGVGGTANHEKWVLHSLTARTHVREALAAVGPVGGSILWGVVGNAMTLKDYSLRQRWGAGRAMDVRHARGVLVAALGTLAHHYGYSKPQDVVFNVDSNH